MAVWSREPGNSVLIKLLRAKYIRNSVYDLEHFCVYTLQLLLSSFWHRKVTCVAKRVP